MNVLIAGAGMLARQVARALRDAGHQVTVVEIDGDLVAHLTEQGRLEGVRLMAGNACDLAVLEAAGALRADVLVAATGTDEDNLVICLLAKRRCAVPQVVARVNDPGNRWLFDERWGVDVAVSGSATLVSLIQEATQTATTVDLLRLRRAGLELFETRLTEVSRARDRRLRDLGLPDDVVVASVIRDGRPLVASGSLRLLAGDQLLVLSHSARGEDIQALFHGGPQGSAQVGSRDDQ